MIRSYAQEEVIHLGNNSIVIHGKNLNFNTPVCIKVLNQEFPTSDQSWYFENEYELSLNATCPVLRKAYQQMLVENHKGIVFEYIGGLNLREYLRETHSYQELLGTAIELARGLSELHKENIIHNNISVDSILIEAQTGKIFFVDLQIASRSSMRLEDTNNFILGKANLSYIAPEQTGRINRAIDYRTDLYSLGVVLYEMFTKKLPFEYADAVELIHAHLAKTPVPPDKVDPKISPVVSAVIMKLLAKNGEDRYQSAIGVYYDLKHCLENPDKNDSLVLGENDFPGKLFLHPKLYGKDKERKTLFRIFDQVAAGATELAMVCGYSGSGKTSLVNELQRPVLERKGFFLGGKFDQFQQDIPYSAFIQAFKELIDYFLTKDNETRTRWRNNILDNVGALGRVLTDLIPGIDALIGPQPEIPRLKGPELQSRFNYVLGNFIKAIACEDNPLVIFIDDLQWADASSLNLFDLILTDKSAKYIMLIGVYRDNEITEDHPLQHLINRLKSKKVDFHTIRVADLEENDVKNMVIELLRTDQENSDELSQMIHSKTKGNPFYIHRFLQSIYDEGNLFFDFENKQWKWKTDEITQMNVSGNVADLMRFTINKLPERTIEVLKVATCLGMWFDLSKLSLATGMEENTLQSILQLPLAEGLIISATSHYKFAHDRIQHTIYSLLSEAEQQQYHLKIGKALSTNIRQGELDEHIFDLVNHWNIGANVLQDQQSRNYVADLNLQAGRKARGTAAYQQAFQFFEKSLQLLAADCWKTNYDFTLQLHNEAAEAAFLVGEMDRVEELVMSVLNNIKELKDSLSAQEIKIQKLIAGNKQNEAIALGLEILERLGIKFPSNPGKLSTIAGFFKLKMLLGNKPSSFFENLPLMTNPTKLAAYRILSELLSAGYWAAPNLVPLLIFKMVELSVKDGLSPKSPFAFIAYGYILSAYMGQVDQGIQLGEIALNVSRRLGTAELTPRLLMTKDIFLIHWKVKLSEINEELERAFKAGLEAGDNEYTTYLAQNIAYNSFYSGASLSKLAERCEALDQQVEKFRQDLTIIRLRIFRQSISNLINDTAEPDALTGGIFDEHTTTPTIEEKLQNYNYFENLNLQKLVLALVFNKNEEAYNHAKHGERYQESIKGSVLDLVFYFYQSLAITAVYENADAGAKPGLMKKLKANLKRLKKFESLCKENYKQKRLLVEGELYRIQGNKIKARNAYDYAIKTAVEGHMYHDEALCWERTGQFYKDQKHDQLAQFYFKNAMNAYQRWGADAKVRQMTQRYEELKKRQKTTDASDTSGGYAVDIDLATIVKASTALSGEIVLANLLEKLMQILLENAGAQRGYLILEKNSEMVVEAEINEDADDIKTMQSIPLAECNSIARSVVNYVATKREPVLLDNAAESSLFGDDAYIRQQQSKSILCAPLLNKGKLQGIIYLSNDVTAGAFTPKRLEFIRLISGQMAISIENALFYDRLEQRVEERTKELQLEKKKADDLLLNILPRDVAEELKNTGRSRARRYDNVTVMFTDFRNFTQHSIMLSPEELVGEVDFCFREFDKIITKHGLEKIKTIGDAYLCVGGIPEAPESPARLVRAAIEMRDFMCRMQEEREKLGHRFFQMRIGITTGPVIAGIVGEKKFAYDIWGDTVNTAARMEQSGEVGRINISGVTYDLVKDRFECSYRGKVSAKNKGEIDMYFVETEKIMAEIV